MPRKNSVGLTLVELIMAIAIFGIGMVGFTALFTKIWHNNSYTLEVGQSSLAASQGLNKIADIIRRAKQSDNGAYPIQYADDFDLVVYADYERDSITERIHFYKNGENVMLGITKPTDTFPKTYPSGDQETVVIASHIVNDSGTPIFYYFNQNYPTDEENNPLSTPVSGYILDIGLIKILLDINIAPDREPENNEMQTFVKMRNINP